MNPSTLPLPEPLLTIPDAVQPTPRIPELPRLARQVPDRASVSNPTADITTARLLLVRVFPMLGTSSFTRFGVPDPFEFAKHLKDKSSKTPEVATQPAPVPPARP